MINRMLIFNLIFILLFNGLTDFYFYKYFVAKFTKNRFLRSAHWFLDALFVVGLAVGFALAYLAPDAGYGFLRTFYMLYFTVYLPKLVFMVFSAPQLLSRNRRFKAVFFWIGAFLCAALFAAIIYGITLGRNSLRITHETVVSKDVPQAFDGYRIVHISDTHFGNMRTDYLMRKTLGRIAEIAPDMIIFSGDLINTKTAEAYPFREAMTEIARIAPSFAVMGNHDYGDYVKWGNDAQRRANIAALQDFYRQAGWHLMDNSSQIIRSGGDSIALIGVENWGENPFPKHGKLSVAMRGVENVPFKILVTHNPNHWVSEVRGKENIALTLSGHTHAMQLSVTIFGRRYSPASLRYEYWGGMYRYGDQYLNINEGLGVALIPLRIGALPEITVITLRHE